MAPQKDKPCPTCGFDVDCHKKINDIHIALMGNDELKIEGAMTRLEKVERKVFYAIMLGILMLGAMINSSVGISAFLIGLFK